eukprot:TRINITY_DN778452_c0_g1_i1.p1 TRINITY_DN778452_c0_g1~~TRINITY_DN778452_c0_g1_i1.p1  ORF type:complete len:179 (-),score=39.80 TRINITY_DN778452_c0_g1_i1:205-741(-)
MSEDEIHEKQLVELHALKQEHSRMLAVIQETKENKKELQKETTKLEKRNKVYEAAISILKEDQINAHNQIICNTVPMPKPSYHFVEGLEPSNNCEESKPPAQIKKPTAQEQTEQLIQKVESPTRASSKRKTRSQFEPPVKKQWSQSPPPSASEFVSFSRRGRKRTPTLKGLSMMKSKQ